ncbi:MAG: methyltransferase domain-containing protein [Deltaproteobacteria bacterium]|nr:methyltransferase domain-containing protein [Deltaproteobacteria bacterium]
MNEEKTDPAPLDVESAVRARYSEGAAQRVEALCCPVDYDPRYLKILPQEVLDRDYGCGDPSRYVRPGETVLDLGSGGGKICFIASQIVGPAGKVIGVDMNPDMLDLARRSAPVVAERIGYANVEFRRGKIQDLQLGADAIDAYLAEHPIKTIDELAAYGAWEKEQRRLFPMIPDNSVDVVVSNCVLNLVDDAAKPQLIREIFRVLKVGGRIAISDIISDEVAPPELRNDPVLWSGCISGAFQEMELLKLLEEAGFYGICWDKWDSTPWQVVNGIEFRSATVTAYKGKEGPCMEGLQAVIYKGPWRQVQDDDGHVFRRGERAAVCAKTFKIMTSGPYKEQIIGIEPLVAPAEPKGFDCARTLPRHPRETKGLDYDVTTEAAACCAPGDKCC